ncbi:MAG: sporulation protein YqfD [Firmicutes bacterium]|nr:sporulation protein YqfD [Bacillota bacterium]
MKRFFNPSVRFTVHDADPTLLNRIREFGPKDIAIDDSKISFSIHHIHKRKVSQIVRNYGPEVVVKGSILTPVAYLYSNRRLAALLCVAVIVFALLNTMVFRIEVIGVEGDEQNQVRQVLDDNGIRTLTRRSVHRDSDAALALMESLEFVAHASTRIRGNTLQVLVHRTPVPPPLPTTDLVSSFDAVVTQVVVLSGTAMVRVGDPVRVGQTLISATFQVGTTVGPMDEFGFFTYIPITAPTTALGIVQGRVSTSLAMMVNSPEEVTVAEAALRSQITGEWTDFAAHTTEIPGGIIVEVVGSRITDLVIQ